MHTGVQNTTTQELGALWKQIEGHGFEWISIWDHFYAADATFTPEGVKSGSCRSKRSRRTRHWR